MAHFIALTSHKDESTPDIAAQPAPDPAMFGLPTEDDGTRTDPLLGQNMITGTHYEPDFDALRSASTRIVVAAGRESEARWPAVVATPPPSDSGQTGHLPQRPRWIPGWRVRTDG
jgi:hypothetical protein